MSRLSEKIAESIHDHDIEMLAGVMNEVLGRFSVFNGSDGILVADVREEITDAFDSYMNNKIAN